jgi:hypothetical protein
MQYWDPSTLLKRFVPEADSPLFVAHMSQAAIAISQIGQAQMWGAIARGALPKWSAEIAFGKFQTDVASGRIVVLPFGAEIETKFRALVLQFHRRKPPIRVRTLDAIHLAKAQVLPAEEVVTTDGHLRAGDTALGLKLFP